MDGIGCSRQCYGDAALETGWPTHPNPSAGNGILISLLPQDKAPH